MNTRREFLKLGSVTLVAAGLFAPRSLFASAAGEPLLGVGFAPALPGPGEWAALADAESMLGSDPSFLRYGAQVSIRGFSRGASYAENPGGVELAALFPRSGSADAYRCFHAFSMTGSGTGSPIAFTMPVAAANGLRFRVKRLSATGERRRIASAVSPAGDEQLVALAVNSGGDARLQGGVYVFAFREGTFDREPAWPNYRVVNNGGLLSVPYLDVSYVVLEVDYRMIVA